MITTKKTAVVSFSRMLEYLLMHLGMRHGQDGSQWNSGLVNPPAFLCFPRAFPTSTPPTYYKPSKLVRILNSHRLLETPLTG